MTATDAHLPAPARRFAAIIDGDNLTRGGMLGVGTMQGILGSVAVVVQGWPVAFAMQRRQAQRYMTAYAGHGWGIRFASMAPDAADRMLLDDAASFLSHGVTDLVVASGDHAFTDLALHVRLHVLAYRGGLSKRLRMAATTVNYLDDDVFAPAA